MIRRSRPNPKIVVIGGGTGSFTLLQELKNHTNQITALVNMADDGGSTGELRDEFGVLPPGDIRQCLVALSQAPSELRELFTFRYPKGSKWQGHSFGNLFLSTIELMNRDFSKSITIAGKVLNISGRVLPITLDNCRLGMNIGNKQVLGQYKIDTTTFNGLSDKPELFLDPKPKINEKASQAIEQADMIVVAPGNLYASLAPVLLVDGVSQALSRARAKSKIKVVYICNLVNKPRSTGEFAAHDYVNELERILGQKFIDTVIYNTNQPNDELLNKYALQGEEPVLIDKQGLNALKMAKKRLIGLDLLAQDPGKRNPNDTFINRSLIRHDAKLVAKQLIKLTKK